jgi:hypothetical protein
MSWIHYQQIPKARPGKALSRVSQGRIDTISAIWKRTAATPIARAASIGAPYHVAHETGFDPDFLRLSGILVRTRDGSNG